MPKASYEFSSFRAANDHRHNDSRPAFKGDHAWLPNGQNVTHQRTKGLPTRAERESAEAASVRAAAAAERDGVATALEGADEAFTRLEAKLDEVVRDYEEHVISATAASVLVTKRLRELGFGP